jgi:small subunit ribosomal protein S21
LIEVTRDEQEPIDSLIKRFRRQVTKHKVLQEVKQRTFFISESVQKRMKRRRNERKKRRRS